MVYNAAFEYRAQNQQNYLVDSGFVIEPWTATLELINVLQAQFETTVVAVQKLREHNGLESSFFNDSENIFSDPVKLQHHLQKQLCGLIHYLLTSLQDRENFLRTSKGNERQIQQARENYVIVLKNGVASMLQFGMQDEAFSIAETFEELATLVELTLGHSDPINKIKQYLGTFGELFAKILFQVYHSRGQLKELMEQDQHCSEYLHNFLNGNQYGYLSWIQDVKYGRYQNASSTLWELSTRDPNLKQEGICIALAKLAYLEAHSDVPADEVQEQLKSFDIALDIIAAQKGIAETYKQILGASGHDNFEKVDETVDELVKSHFAGIQSYRIRTMVLKSILRMLFQGKKVRLEGMLDLLTLQTTTETFFDTALEILLNFKMDLETSLKYRLHLLWRYVWLSDNWKDIRSQAETLSDQSLIEMLRMTNTCKLYTWLCMIDSPRSEGGVGTN
jgi:hypothetical protein